MEAKLLSHFSHRHPLELAAEVQEEDHEVVCSGCELELLGSAAYKCTKPKCNFILHDSCIDLPRQIRHKSYPKNPLILQIFPPYNGGEFICNACGNFGHAFSYHCANCKFDLHIECASLPEIEGREDHQHPLLLCYSSPTSEELKLSCCVCHSPLGLTSVQLATMEHI